MARATRSNRPRRGLKRLKGIKVLSRGLKNFVMSDDTSLDEAMAAARSETDREVTAQQLDAFHKTFNFCMTCRQYTCANCWNEAEGALPDVRPAPRATRSCRPRSRTWPPRPRRPDDGRRRPTATDNVHDDTRRLDAAAGRPTIRPRRDASPSRSRR